MRHVQVRCAQDASGTNQVCTIRVLNRVTSTGGGDDSVPGAASAREMRRARCRRPASRPGRARSASPATAGSEFLRILVYLVIYTSKLGDRFHSYTSILGDV